MLVVYLQLRTRIETSNLNLFIDNDWINTTDYLTNCHLTIDQVAVTCFFHLILICTTFNGFY